jgi:hypothetical protein
MTEERITGTMKSRRFSFLFISMLVASGLMTSFIIGCGGNTESVPASSAASFGEAVTCKSFNQSAGPSNATGAFTRNDPWVICAVKISDAPSNTKAKAAWFYQGSQRYTETLGVQGTKWLGFTLKPDNLNAARFPAGSYTVKFYLNGVEKTSLNFTVE